MKDRNVVRTIEDETRTTSPIGLQDAIDALVKKYECGRAFVRPSGTEDAVRIYAEGEILEFTYTIQYSCTLLTISSIF